MTMAIYWWAGTLFFSSLSNVPKCQSSLADNNLLTSDGIRIEKDKASGVCHTYNSDAVSTTTLLMV